MTLAQQYNSFPPSTVYTNVINSAINDFNNKCGVAQFFDIQLVAGTYSYALPTNATRIKNVTLSSALNPLIQSYQRIKIVEPYSFLGGNILFTVIPRIDVVTVEYIGGFDINTITDREWQVIKKIAYANILQLQAAEAGKDAFSFILGTETVDKRVQSSTMALRAQEAIIDAEAARKSYIGLVFRSSL